MTGLQALNDCDSKDGSSFIYESRAPSILATNSAVGSFDATQGPPSNFSSGSRMAMTPSSRPGSSVSGRSRSSIGHASRMRSNDGANRLNKLTLLSPNVRAKSAASFNSGNETMPRPTPQPSLSSSALNGTRSSASSKAPSVSEQTSASGKRSFGFGNESNATPVTKNTADSRKSISFKQPPAEAYSESQSASMTLTPKVDHGNAGRSVSVSQTASYVQNNGATQQPRSQDSQDGLNAKTPSVKYSSNTLGTPSSGHVPPSSYNKTAGPVNATHIGSRLSQDSPSANSVGGVSQNASPQSRATTFHRGSWSSDYGSGQNDSEVYSVKAGSKSSSQPVYESKSYVLKTMTHVGAKSSLSSKPPLAASKASSTSGSNQTRSSKANKSRVSGKGNTYAAGSSELAKSDTQSSRQIKQSSLKSSTYEIGGGGPSASVASSDDRMSRSSGSVKQKGSNGFAGGGGGGVRGGGGIVGTGSGGGYGGASRGYASEADADSMGAGGDRNRYGSVARERRISLPAHAKPSTTLMRGGDVDILTPRRTSLTCHGDLLLLGRPNAPPVPAKPFTMYNVTPATKMNPWIEPAWTCWSPCADSSECLFHEMEMNSLQEQHMALLRDYQAFFQQQFSFVRALEHARSPHHWDDARIVEVRCMEHVAYYINKVKRSGNALHLRVMTVFYKIYTGCKVHFNNLFNFFENFSTPMGLTRSERSQVVSKLNELKFTLSKKYNFFNLRVAYPHQQVFRLSVEEAKRLYGGAVSYLPIVLDLLDNTRTTMNHIMKSKKLQPMPSYASAPPHFMIY